MTDLGNLKDIQETDLAPIAQAFAELIMKIEQASPGWKRIAITREDNGVARLEITDGSDEVMLQ
jgi:hypothetical protein